MSEFTLGRAQERKRDGTQKLVYVWVVYERKYFILLQGLSGDLGAREVLIGELREAAEPLREGCAAEVREKVEAAVNEAVQAWEDTRAELDALCTKYQHACRLWQQYKDSSAAVKAWVDTQMDSVANLPPEEAVKHIKVRANVSLFTKFAQLVS